MRWFLLVIALVCLSAQAQQSPPKNPKDQQRHTGATQQQSATDERGTEKSPVIVKVLPTPEDKAKADEDAKERKEKAELDRRLVELTGDLARYTDNLALFTAVLAIATIVLVLVTGGTVVMMLRQEKITAKGLLASEKSAVAAEKAANAAIQAAEATKTHVAIASNELRLAHRAWVGVSHEIEIISPLRFSEEGAKMTIRMSIKNVGGSPSLSTSAHKQRPMTITAGGVDPRTLHDMADESFIRMISKRMMGIVVLPGEPVRWVREELFIPKKEISPGADGQVSVWLSGCISYQDEFGIYANGFRFSYAATDGSRRFKPAGVVDGAFETVGVGWGHYHWKHD